VTTDKSDFSLIETMRVSEQGDVYLLEGHLTRMARSAAHFGFECDLAEVRVQVTQAAKRDANPARLRLLLSKGGTVTLERGPLPVDYVRQLKLSNVRVHSSDVFLQHKTTKRGIYDAVKRECDAQTDAILINERGEITETSIMNIALLRNGRWITPQVSCGLLPGVMREELLARGQIVEGRIRAEELCDGEGILCFNALRGVLEVPVNTKH
jgi:para-aminobenzoate synthetase/4-amino-4-deoxychorismate lyase